MSELCGKDAYEEMCRDADGQVIITLRAEVERLKTELAKRDDQCAKCDHWKAFERVSVLEAAIREALKIFDSCSGNCGECMLGTNCGIKILRKAVGQ